MGKKINIAITLPEQFSIRNFLFTDVWNELAQNDGANFFLLSDRSEVAGEIKERAVPHIQWKYPERSANKKQLVKSILNTHPLSRIKWMCLTHLHRHYLYDSLIYRFFAINNLSNYKVRQAYSKSEQERRKYSFDYRLGEAAGFPFPRSQYFYSKLYNLYYDSINTVYKEDLEFLDGLNLDLFVFGRLYMPNTAYWMRMLKHLRIPTMGIVSSWDHPTSKGPIVKGLHRVIIETQRMKDEVNQLHGIDEDRLLMTGKVHMDIYKDASIIKHREDFLKELKIPISNKIITFGTNAKGLKEHEVSVAEHLANEIQQGKYGDTTLIIRTHPQDVDWQTDFGILSAPPKVICLNACSFGYQYTDKLDGGNADRIFLCNLMKHSNVVIQSRSSLALDAIAFDRPVISIGFDGDLKRQQSDSFIWEYVYEHFKPIVKARASALVGSYSSLTEYINLYLEDPTIHHEGRQQVREQMIEPFDGCSCKRLVSFISTCADQAVDGGFSEANWNYTGLGDISWHKRQGCSVEEYVV